MSQGFSVRKFVEDEIISLRKSIGFLRMEALMLVLIMVIYGGVIAYTGVYNYISAFVILGIMLILIVEIIHYITLLRAKRQTELFYDKVKNVYARMAK